MKAFIFTLLLFAVGIDLSNAQDRTILNLKKAYFQCPPCNLPCDTVHFSSAGTCPTCGMKLFATYRGFENQQGDHSDFIDKKVAVLIFPGVEIIDFTGPWEVLAAAGMEVYSVSENENTVQTSMGLKIKPDYTFSNAPQPDILLVPGGNVKTSNQTVTNWILEMNKHTEHTMSVCNGAYYLGKIGLLDNLKATTVFPGIELLRKIAPKAMVVDSMRYTDNGKIISSAGLSSGIDAAFHLVATYIGNAQAKKLAVTLEYSWNEDQQFVRGKLADKYVQDVLNVLTPFDYELTTYQGSEHQWQVSLQVTTQLTKAELLSLFDFQLKETMGWQQAENSLQWTLNNNNKNWKSNLDVQESAKNTFVVSFKVQQF